LIGSGSFESVCLFVSSEITVAVAAGKAPCSVSNCSLSGFSSSLSSNEFCLCPLVGES